MLPPSCSSLLLSRHLAPGPTSPDRHTPNTEQLQVQAGGEERCFVKGSKTFLGEVRGPGHECALSLRWFCTPGRPLLPLPAHPGGRWREEGPAPSQEALGVGRACGNDFIGKACDIFSPPVCGSWRKLEVVVISVALAAGSGSGSRSRAEALAELAGRPLQACRPPGRLCLHSPGPPSSHRLPPPRSTLSRTCRGPPHGGSLFSFSFLRKTLERSRCHLRPH